MPRNGIVGPTTGDTGGGDGRSGPRPLSPGAGPDPAASPLRDRLVRSQERTRKLREEFADDEGGTFVPGPGYGLPAGADPADADRERR